MQLLTEKEAASFCDFIDRHDFFYICGHKEPDGDCIFSCIALGMLVQKKAKSFSCFRQGLLNEPKSNNTKIDFHRQCAF